MERLARKSRKRVEAKGPGQPKPGQGQAAGFAGRAKGASLDLVPGGPAAVFQTLMAGTVPIL